MSLSRGGCSRGVIVPFSLVGDHEGNLKLVTGPLMMVKMGGYGLQPVNYQIAEGQRIAQNRNERPWWQKKSVGSDGNVRVNLS